MSSADARLWRSLEPEVQVITASPDPQAMRSAVSEVLLLPEYRHSQATTVSSMQHVACPQLLASMLLPNSFDFVMVW